MNSINITGRLTSDPELKITPNNIPVCSFSIAVQRPKVKETTDFLTIVAWRQSAEFVSKYFSKGQMIAVSGVLTTRNYKDKSGNKHTAFEVVAEDISFCGDKKQDFKQELPQGFTEINGDDDMPF